MGKTNDKDRLFEVMKRLDKTFGKKINEEFRSDADYGDAEFWSDKLEETLTVLKGQGYDLEFVNGIVNKVFGGVNPEAQMNETITSGELYRDMNDQLIQLLNNVSAKYQIQKEEGAQAIVDYFQNKQWNTQPQTEPQMSESYGGDAYSINGYYGTNNPTEIFIYGNWYAVEGSTNVNKTNDLSSLVNGVNVETISDVNTFQADNPINSTEDLIDAVDN